MHVHKTLENTALIEKSISRVFEKSLRNLKSVWERADKKVLESCYDNEHTLWG